MEEGGSYKEITFWILYNTVFPRQNIVLLFKRGKIGCSLEVPKMHLVTIPDRSQVFKIQII